MKNIFKILFKKHEVIVADQEALLDFVNDKKNLEKAAQGSMEKRLELIERARTQTI